MRPQLSRRAFLQLAGIVSLSASGLPGLFSTVTSAESYGRLLRPITSPDGTTSLPKDAVVRFSRWGEPEFTGLTAADFQMMPGFRLYPPTTVLPSDLPALMEVRSPSAPVYRRCDVLSDVVTRMGYGSGAWVVDTMPSGRIGASAWVAVAGDDGMSLGWSPADAWQLHDAQAQDVQVSGLRIDRQHHRMYLTLSDGEKTEWMIASNSRAASSHTQVVDQRARCQRTDGTLSWSVILGNGVAIGGADWHNDFGCGGQTEDIEIHPCLAKWLYVRVVPGTMVDFGS